MSGCQFASCHFVSLPGCQVALLHQDVRLRASSLPGSKVDRLLVRLQVVRCHTSISTFITGWQATFYSTGARSKYLDSQVVQFPCVDSARCSAPKPGRRKMFPPERLKMFTSPGLNARFFVQAWMAQNVRPDMRKMFKPQTCVAQDVQLPHL